jgi:PAS domain S-box-containing protein
VAESFFDEVKRYVRFGDQDAAALRALAPAAAPHFRAIADEFYARLAEHDEARNVFSGPEQVDRLKGTLCGWMELLLNGPWDEAYYQKRARIGRMHVKIALPQRYMFGAMNVIRVALQNIARAAIADVATRQGTVVALAKIIDLELAIMLETYREAFVDKVQALERHERDLLAGRLAIIEARYQEIVEKAWSLVTTFDEAGTILLFNRRCEELTGLTREQAIGRSFHDLFIPDEKRAEVTALCEKVRREQHVALFEGNFASANGGERRVRWHLTTLPSGTGPVMCAMGVDVTGEHALAVRTRRAERLASLGTMAAGLAHEIRNPLNAAHLQLTVVKRRLGRAGVDATGALQAAELVAAEMQRLSGLVDEFLQFARPQPLRLGRVDLGATVKDVVALLQPQAGEAGVELRAAPDGPVDAEVDDERIRQVLLNLVRNAIEATGGRGHIVLRTRRDDDGASLEVEDDGPGLPAEAPIFEPFFTTKPQGTGLGLSIVHRIVTDHGGKISVESRPGRTVFKISLPG